MIALIGRAAGKALAWVLPIVLPFIYEKISSAVKGWIDRRRASAEIERKNQLARELTEAAQTKEERDAAANAIRNNLGS